MTTTYPASEKQLAFVTRLLGERVTTGTRYEGHTTAPALTKQQASDAITELLALPKAEQPTGTEPEAGVYTFGGALYRVYLGQQSGRMLVKSIDAEWAGERCYCSDLQGVPCAVCRGEKQGRFVSEVTYTYLGAAATHLPEKARRMALEEVGSIGLAWNHCLVCGRRLDDPESVDRGIGPVCAKKY